MWVKTEMSEPDNERWTLNNDLGLAVNLIQRSIAAGNVFDGWNYRIGEFTFRLNTMSSSEAKYYVIQHLKRRVELFIGQLG